MGGWRLLVVGVLAVTAAACSSTAKASPHHRRAGTGSTTTTAVPGATTGSSGKTAGGPPAAAPASGAARAASAPAPSPAAPPASSGPAPATPGTYRYDQSGSFSALGSTQSVPGQGTIVVDAATAQGSGRWAQVWHSYVDPSQPPSDTTFSIAPSGIALVSEVIRMEGQTFTCTFSSPMLVVDWPPTVGHHFSGSADCGSFTAQATGAISGTATTSVGGVAVTAYVVTTQVTTSGSVSSTSTETDWIDPAHELDIRQQTQEKGTYQGIAFQSDVTRSLVSLQPG
jgi:hypothetical protein